MSGIYIKAFKAPTSCWDCQFRGLKSLVGCTACLTYSNRDDMGIASANCKIISVPDHGRLIDEKVFFDKWMDASWNCLKMQVGREDDIRLLLKITPTVIPADKGADE